jgi:hypothetical protein
LDEACARAVRGIAMTNNTAAAVDTGSRTRPMQNLLN